MINYNNRNLTFIFFNRAGSVLFSRYVLLPAVLSTVFCALLIWRPEARLYGSMSKTIAQIYATIIGFAIVFRTTMAFGRYFEGVRHIQAMFSKWRDAYVAQAVFIETSIMKHEHDGRVGLSKSEAVEQVVHDLRFSKARLLHWFSLLCAVAVESIQHGRDLECDVAAELSHARVTGMFSKSDSSVLVQENAEVLRARSEEEKWEVRNHIQILGQITPEELTQISRAQEAVNLVMMWILLEITNLSITRKVLIEPPILSRVYQELSNGTLSYFRAMQIECVPFPFPFAQVVNYTLHGYFFFCPFIVMDILQALRSPGPISLEQMWPALLLNFFAVAGYAALNEIAIELEDPFGDDDNEYPVAIQQWAITWAIEDSYFAPVPSDIFDARGSGGTAIADWNSEAGLGKRTSLRHLMTPKSLSGGGLSGLRGPRTATIVSEDGPRGTAPDEVVVDISSLMPPWTPPSQRCERMSPRGSCRWTAGPSPGSSDASAPRWRPSWKRSGGWARRGRPNAQWCCGMPTSPPLAGTGGGP